MKRTFILVMFFLLSTAFAADKICAYYFYSPTCPHCEKVSNYIFSNIMPRYYDRLELRRLDISGNYSNINFAQKLSREDDKPFKGVPMLFIKNKVIFGDVDIINDFESIIEECLRFGGCSCPDYFLVEGGIPISTVLGLDYEGVSSIDFIGFVLFVLSTIIGVNYLFRKFKVIRK